MVRRLDTGHSGSHACFFVLLVRLTREFDRAGASAYQSVPSSIGGFDIGTLPVAVALPPAESFFNNLSCSGDATSFSPAIVLPLSTSTVLVSGSALSTTDTTVRLESGTTCTAAGAGQLLDGGATGGGATLTVTVGTANLSTGAPFSVCVRLHSAGVFFKAGSSEIGVRCVGWCISFRRAVEALYANSCGRL